MSIVSYPGEISMFYNGPIKLKKTKEHVEVEEELRLKTIEASNYYKDFSELKIKFHRKKMIILSQSIILFFLVIFIFFHILNDDIFPFYRTQGEYQTLFGGFISNTYSRACMWKKMYFNNDDF